MVNTLTKEELQNRITQSLMWLGFQDVEFDKRFSANKFEKGKTNEEVFETNISYSAKDNLLPDKIADTVIKIFENIIDYHIRKAKVQEVKAQKEKLKNKESESKVDNN